MKKQTPPTPTVTEAQLAGLLAQLSKIKADRDVAHAELVRIDKLNRGRAPGQIETSERTKAARELLNGAVADLLPPLAANADPIATLRERVATFDEALEEGSRHVARLRYQAGIERFQGRADDVRTCMAGIVDAVVGLERALQRRDALLKEIKPPAELLPGAGWVFLGRIGRSESQAYRFMQAAVAAGWIPNEKLRAEIEASRKAMA